MVEKGVRGGIGHTIDQYAKPNNKYMKNYDRNKKSSYLILCCKNLYGWAMSQNLPVNDFKWDKEISGFNEDFIKSYNDYSDAG